LQLKAALHACQDVNREIPVMISVTIEENNSMLV
jgi:methionine synthase I (cobalamin-dependent)